MEAGHIWLPFCFFFVKTIVIKVAVISMKKLLWSFCIIAVITCYGCKEVPNEVKQEISILDQQSGDKKNDDFEIEYQTMSDIRENAQSLATRNSRIVQIKKDPVIPTCDMLPVYQLFPINLSDSDTEECFSKVKNALLDSMQVSLPEAVWYHDTIPMDQISGIDENGNARIIDVSSYNWSLFADGIHAVREDDTGSLTVAKRGAVCNFWQDLIPPVYYPSLEIEAVVPVGYDKAALSQSYKMMNGEEWSLQDAKNFAETFYNNTFSDWCDLLTFQVKEIRVKKLPQGGYGYDFTLQQVYNNKQIPILPLEYLNYPRIPSVQNNIIFGKTCSMWCVSPNIVQEISMNGIYNFQKISEEKTKFVSAESALDIVSHALAKEKTVYAYMELGYAGIVSESEYCAVSGNLNEIDVVLQNGDYKSSSAVPYWFIWEPIDQVKPRMSGNYYLVNALNGELEIL